MSAALRALFSFHGELDRRPYALAAAAAFLLQHVMVAAILLWRGIPLDLLLRWEFAVSPLQLLSRFAGLEDRITILAFGVALLVAWVQAALAFRRACDAGVTPFLAVPAIAPLAQIAVYLFLATRPRAPGRQVAPQRLEGSLVPMVLLGAVTGIGTTLLMVAVGALLFGAYGWGMFAVGPFIIGVTVGYFVNRQRDIGLTATSGLALVVVALGGGALIATALEGLFCIVLASPLAAVSAVVGAAFGQGAANKARHRSLTHAFACVALLPVILASETLLPPAAVFHSEQSVEIAASPSAVWHALVAFDMRDSERPLTARVGMAYPIRAELAGEGVGASRIGVFSTGHAIEEVTAWVPERRLAFVVRQDPPSMRELSPYDYVHAPHVAGYFRTLETSFELLPLEGGGTRLVERTSHELRIDPVPYWLPVARWAVARNNASVLAHLKRQAESAM